jgi:hypothetical protein
MTNEINADCYDFSAYSASLRALREKNRTQIVMIVMMY